MMSFTEYRQRGLKFYKRVARELQVQDDLAYADRLVTCLLHVLRERMTISESLEFISVLPVHIKGVYVHGWKLNPSPKRLSSEEEFLNALRIKYPHTTGKKPGNDEALRKDIRGILTVIQSEATAKGIQDIKKYLPEVLHPFCERADTQPVLEIISEGNKHFPEVQPIKTEV